MPAPAAARCLMPSAFSYPSVDHPPEPRRVWTGKTRRIDPALQIMTGWLALLLLSAVQPGPGGPVSVVIVEGSPETQCGFIAIPMS